MDTETRVAVGFTIVLWWLLLIVPQGTVSQPIALALALGAVALVFLMLRPVLRGETHELGSRVVAAATLVLGGFSSLYWQFGGDSRWSCSLSRVDALYVAAGAMTTAGSGSVTPQSDLVRAFVTAQFVVDAVLITVLAALALMLYDRQRK